MLCYFFFCRDESSVAIVNVFLAIFVIITLVLIILILVGYKKKWIKFTCGKRGPKGKMIVHV